MLSLPTNRPLPRVPRLVSSLPTPHARTLIERDKAVTSLFYTRGYPLVATRGEGYMVKYVDDNLFLDGLLAAKPDIRF